MSVRNLDMSKILLPLILLLAMTACNPRQQNSVVLHGPAATDPSSFQPAKNVVLMIGDGMGITQISAALFSNNNYLFLQEFPATGLQKTYAADNLITDSAAGATAMACGVKTNNGAIGVSEDSLPVQSLAEEAKSKGLATGVITTSTIVHATPAAFLAHQPRRNMYYEIALDICQSDADLLIGGGKKYFEQRADFDGRNLSKELSLKNYFVSDYFQSNLAELSLPSKKNLLYFTANDDPVPYSKGREYLPQACEMAPPFLQNRSSKGFFLVVEGAQIDWGGHANDADYIIQEMLDFDRAIGKILEFAKKDGETLVIVTGDHETGGFAINPGSKYDALIPAFTTDYHTGALIPVFAYGPGSGLFGGIFENTAIYEKIRMALQFDFPKSSPQNPSDNPAGPNQ